MPRKYRTSAMISAFILIAIIVAVLLRAREPASAAALPAKVAMATDRPMGSSGGTLLTSGALSIEVSMSEKDGDARLVVLPFVDGKRATKNVSVTGSLGRYDGTRQPLSFAADAASRFTTITAIARPHVFDATIAVTASDRSATFTFSQADGAIALNAEQIKSSRIEISRAGPAQVVDRLRLPGEIRLDEDHTAHVVPRVAGIVERVDVSIGQTVKQGQLLAVISSPDLADRRSELLAAQRRLSAARTTYERERSLWQERISAEQDYLQAQTQLREAEIAAQNARQKLAAIDANSGAGALNRYELRAPFAGTVIEKHIVAGEAVAGDTNVFVLSDLSSVWAEMAVPAQRLNDVRVGRAVTVSATAFESSASGRIAFVGALLGEATRTAPARVVLANPGGAWRPGMFVDVAVDADARDVPVAVRADALLDIDGAPSVFVLSPKGFVAQPVQTGRRDAQTIEIVAGLQPGQQYAAANAFVLKAELGKGSAEEH
ncbi:efflux RND transporter periplasmic adaptor subunit [Paraburkholderia sp. SARCC-3016]|uniref:efflux RND transporter periplasmic adaptor subunit n=1 Tax=Paraburkholderia sp. SARCC-3016 TaxID=3058611 RepID=UPI0035BE3B58